MNEMHVRIRMEAMLREMSRKGRCAVPELTDEELRALYQEHSQPSRMDVMKFAAANVTSR